MVDFSDPFLQSCLSSYGEELLSHVWLDETNRKIKSIPIQGRTEPKKKKVTRGMTCEYLWSSFNHTGLEILVSCVSCWAYYKDVVFGIFHKRAVDNSILVTLQSPNPFVIQHSGIQGKSMALTVGVSSLTLSFSAYSWRRQKISFSYSILHHLEMLSSL